MKREVSTPVVIAVFAVVAIILVGLGYYFLRPRPYVPSPGLGGRPAEVPHYGPPRGSPMPPADVMPGQVSKLREKGITPSAPPPSQRVLPGSPRGAQNMPPMYPPPPR